MEKTLKTDVESENEKMGVSGISVPDGDVISRIREIFYRNKYATKINQKHVEFESKSSLEPIDVLPRLFSACQPVRKNELLELLTTDDISEWQNAGLINVIEGRVIPLVKIKVFRGLLIASDIEWARNLNPDPNVVMGITDSTISLLDYTVRRHSHRTLDLGTGMGVQALLAAKHSDEVTAVDLNPRSLEFARLNASLNNITNVSFVEGDMFEAVKGKRFDLIICNPPFSVSPERECLYRDNPLDGDEFIRQLVERMPAHLNDGGFAEIICNWEEHRDQPWEKRLAGWVSRKDCDAWILRNSSSSAESYSRAWLSDVSPENFKQKTEEWINYFNDRHVSSVGIGMIVMRLAEGRDNWIRVDSACPKKLANAGKHVERIFELQSYINSIPENADLLERRFTISPFSVLEQRHQPGKKGWQYTGAQLSLTEGIASTVQLNQNTVKLIVRCDGNKSIGNLLAETVEPDQKEAVLEQVRNLVMLGFLWPNELCSTKESEDCLQAGNGKDLESGIIQNPSEDRRNLPDVKIHRPNQHLPVNRIVSKFLGSRGVSI